ncbi:hypothetical protein HN680_02150, partial [Candidatus Peregrinibacteria bacterium]|nr:hypothetical protein [Candidatus Peregrinibacteria bacterium]
ATSLRDIRREDQNGRWLNLNGQRAYMMGVPEVLTHSLNGDEDRLLEWTQGIGQLNRQILGPEYFDAMERCILKIGAAIRERFQLVGVVFDDSPLPDLHPKRGEAFSMNPSSSDWIWAPGLRTPNGELLSSNTVSIPSDYRRPINTDEQRHTGKQEFEQQLRQVIFGQMDADILLSDHLMVILEDLVKAPHDFRGRLLNIHPAITNLTDPDCFRGDTPTADAIAAAQTRAVHTGSTFHFIDPGIDTGPPIARLKPTPVLPTDQPQELRLRNYLTKGLVALEGLVHYYDQLYNTFRPGDGQQLTRSTHALPLHAT